MNLGTVNSVCEIAVPGREESVNVAVHDAAVGERGAVGGGGGAAELETEAGAELVGEGSAAALFHPRAPHLSLHQPAARSTLHTKYQSIEGKTIQHNIHG